MALQKGVHMWERIRLNTYDFKDGQWIRQENFCEFQIEEMIGEGTFCWTYRARKGNVVGKTVALKEIKRADGMTAKEYERTAQDYLADIWNYKKAMEAAQREVLSVNAIYVSEKDENIFIEQDYLDGMLYSKFRFEQFDLEKELILFKKLLHFLKVLHQQNLFILDLKQENFMVVTGNNEPEVVYFDLYLYNGEEKGRGEKCYPEGKLSYVEKYLRKNEFQRADLILSTLVLYERLNQTEELPKSKANIKIPDEKSQVQKKIREIFMKGWDGGYECCDDLEKDIDDLEELLKEVPVPELLTEWERFVPRENACKEIEKILKCSDGRRHICVITGEGGSGKSELAREYSRYAKNSTDISYTDIYWITCSEGESAAVDKLMETVGIGKEDAIHLTASKLLIFDNCNFNEYSFNRDLYEKTGDAHVIVTSRVQSLNGVSGDTLYLEKYQTEEFAMRVFQKNCESSLIGNSVQIPKTYQEMIKKLIRQISCNTLLSAMLGIVLRDYLHLGETEFCEHLQMISNSIQKCLEDEPEIHLNRKLYGDKVVQDIADGEENIGSILQIVFSDELLRRYSETEYKILTLLKVCPNRFINKDFILKLAVDTDQTPIKKQRIINRLVNDNWIKYGEINGEKEITMHPIVALAIKDRALIDQRIEGFYNELLTKIVSLKINEPEYAEENRIYVSILLRNFRNKMADKLALSLTAYEYGDFSLADCIIKSKYKNSLQKPIAFMKGFGTKKKNYLYLIAYDGEKVIGFSTIKISNNLKIKGKIVWCWDNYRCNKFVDFQFKATVKCQCEYVEDIIEITEIARNCFSKNKHIVSYDFKGSLNEITGRIVQIEQIGEAAFCQSEVVEFSCESELMVQIAPLEFYKCTNLLYVKFNKSKLRIFGEHCFCECGKLQSLYFDNECGSEKFVIENSAFYNCSELKRIANDTLIIDRVGNMAFCNCTKLKTDFEIKADEINMQAFEGCESIECVKIDASTKYIGMGAFEGCKRIMHLDFPDSIEEIDTRAFFGCALKYIVLSGNKKVTKTAFSTRDTPIKMFSTSSENGYIEFSDDGTFFKKSVIEVTNALNLKNVNLCKNLFLINDNVKINIGERVKVCGEEINSGNIKKIESVFILKNEKTHPDFKCIYDTEKNVIQCLVVPRKKLKLYRSRKNKRFLKYYNKDKLKNNSKVVEFFGKNISEKEYICSDIEKIWGKDVVRIEKEGLFFCKTMKTSSFPELKYIEDRAFAYCSKLKNVNIPQVIEIGKCGFEFCKSLERLEIPNVEKIGTAAFAGCEVLREIEIKKLNVICDYTFKNCVLLKKVVVGKDLKEIGEFAFVGCSELTHIKFARHISIKKSAFAGCTNLSHLNWEYIDNISREAFSGCHFLNICFSKKISCILSNAFMNNYYLREVEFDNNDIYIEDGAFDNCIELTKMDTYYVKYLGKSALSNTSLKKLIFQNIHNIGSYCFEKSANLEYVFIKCLEEKMTIEAGIFEGCTALKEIWIDHDGIDEIYENAFPNGVSIYVVQGSSIEKTLIDRKYTKYSISSMTKDSERECLVTRLFSAEKKLFNGGYMICPISPYEMEIEWNRIKGLNSYDKCDL